MHDSWGITVHPLVTSSSNNPKSAKQLVKTSRTSSDGSFVAVLSIWPSKEFDDLYNSRKSPVIFLANTYRYSSGWTGQYERYLFALAIGPNTQYFTVLRNLYVVTPANSKSAARYSSIPLALEFNNTNEMYWEPVKERLEKGDMFAKYIRIDDRVERQRSLKSYLYWIFFDHKTQHICFVDQLKSSTEQDKGSSVMEARSQVEQLRFSACGTYFVTTLDGISAPLVHPVPPIHLKSKSPDKNVTVQELDSSAPIYSKHSLLHELSSTPSTDIAYHWTGNPDERVLQTRGAMVFKEGVATIRSQYGTLQPQLSQSTSLTLLPSWSMADTIQPDIILPANRNDNLRMILDRTMQDWNNISANPDTNFLTIVERDPRTLRTAKREQHVPEALLGGTADDPE
ncbi:hypothetical protein G7Y89_g4513 [Cudoniella acicularis]|uniref:Uncharacterized protein n=1 Tax=Cudoniella acicularis TaxID=354080 RepID=A0A8H4RPB0_9HELO|nr:hypothetical protein G7Y89_g4513 [Cudoniella acicularis]